MMIVSLWNLTGISAALFMMSSKGNIFRVTGRLCGKFTGHRWIPHTKASDVGLLMFSLFCDWINSWVNNCEAVDLRRHHAHYDVIVMCWVIVWHREGGTQLSEPMLTQFLGGYMELTKPIWFLNSTCSILIYIVYINCRGIVMFPR